MILVIGGRNQGKSTFIKEKFPDKTIINEFHYIIKNAIEEGKDIEAVIKKAMEDADIIVCDDIGSGIIPIDKEEDLWREETGRALCKIASKADEVYRVVVGIAQKIK